MINKTIILFLIIIQFSCSNYFYNLAFEKIGSYKTEIKLLKYKKNNIEIIGFPMVHLSNKDYYNDVKSKIDSLKKLNYYFYYEHVKGDVKDTLTLYKIRKLTGIPIPKNETGHKGVLDSFIKSKNVKLKKDLIPQPSYTILGLNESNSSNIDASLKLLIETYEKKYSEVVLEKCDFENNYFSKPKCKLNKVLAKQFDEIKVNFRNDIVIEEVKKEKKEKIAIIYGANHFIGIEEELIKEGYHKIF